MADCLEKTEEMVEGILLPWNPFFEPETIRVHVTEHRASKPERFGWWGRFGLGTSQQFSRGPVACAFELLSTQTERRPVFVTDFVRLHALKVVEVSRERPQSACGYYKDRPISMWLRFDDIRAISHNQSRTLHYLREDIIDPEMRSCRGIDPYASMAQLYPRLIRAKGNDVLFDRDGAPPSGYYADADDAIDQPITEEAFRRLRDIWREETWEGLADFTRECLAQADVLFRDEKFGVKHHADGDRASVLFHLARAIERELVSEILTPLMNTARHERANSKTLIKLREALANLKGELTLGAFVRVVVQETAFASWVEEALHEGSAVKLVRDHDWRRWLSHLKDRRNATIHPREGASRDEVLALATQLLDAGGGEPARVLDTITGAKRQFREFIAEAQGSPADQARMIAHP
jgi:hypothetical protein